MSELLVHYDSTCEAVGLRIVSGSRHVADAILQYTRCTSWKGVANKARYCRDKAVREQRFLAALIHDTILANAIRGVENS